MKNGIAIGHTEFAPEDESDRYIRPRTKDYSGDVVERGRELARKRSRLYRARKKARG
jgi:hypothetical protein